MNNGTATTNYTNITNYSYDTKERGLIREFVPLMVDKRECRPRILRISLELFVSLRPAFGLIVTSLWSRRDQALVSL